MLKVFEIPLREAPLCLFLKALPVWVGVVLTRTGPDVSWQTFLYFPRVKMLSNVGRVGWGQKLFWPCPSRLHAFFNGVSLTFEETLPKKIH